MDLIIHKFEKLLKEDLKENFFSKNMKILNIKEKMEKKGKAIIFTNTTNTIFYENKYCGLVILIDVTEQKKIRKA